MDVKHIKALLHAARPGEPLPEEAEKAREIAAKDPELKAWMDGEAAFDKAFAAKLNAVEPPPELLGKILTAHDADVGKVVPFPRQESSKFVADTRRGKFLRYGVSAAAALIIVAGVVFYTRRSAAPEDTLEGFVDGTVVQALSDTSAMRDADTVAAVVKGLQSGYAPVPDELPADLGKLRPASYGVLHTQQGNIGQIAFNGSKSFRLLVLERRCLGGCSSKLGKPVMFDLGDNLAVGWTKGSQVYILVSDRSGESVIRKVAKSAGTSL